MDDIRNRFLRDRVLTASPAQRVVMLYERLALDIARAQVAESSADAVAHLQHGTQIVAELLGSLDPSAGGPAENLARIYQFVIGELLAAQLSGERSGLPAVARIVDSLGAAWTAVASGATASEPVPAGSWTA